MEVAGLVASFLSCLCANNCVHNSIGQQCGSFLSQKRKLRLLEEKMDYLAATAADLERKLENTQVQQGMEPKARVKLWLDHVWKTVEEGTMIVTLANRSRRLQCYPKYLVSRIKLGKRIEEKIMEVSRLEEKLKTFEDDLFGETLVKRGRTLPTILPMMNPTTMECFSDIWDYMMDSQVGRIGVYGMGGVGKTTIMTEINNRLLNGSAQFDCVIWVNVSKESDTVERLQIDIAEQLNLDCSPSATEIGKCAQLFDALCRRKRFVLILDDLWEPFSLEKVGIPVPTPENGCKLVLTTRSMSICRAMETQQDVEVKVLSEIEEWSLFREKVGEAALLPGIQNIAKAVAKECGGLPLAIVTVGRALHRVSDISEWENALAELRSSTATNMGRMEEDVFAHLRFSLIKLKDDTSRACFLFCSLYPEGHQIDVNELIDYWMWEGLLGDAGTIQELKLKGKRVLSELKNACLLQSGTIDGIELVTIHDLIRDMLIAITSTSPRCLIKPRSGLKKPPWVDEWFEDLQRVSLMRNNIQGIDFKPRCPKLTSLLLQDNPFSKNILDSFFDDMISLEVLDLSSTGISSLPESVSNLENLRALFLQNCWRLTWMPSLENLVKLKVLDISWSRRITVLPHGLEKLRNLRRLDLTHTTIELFPKGLLAALMLLEELLMVGCGFLRGSDREGGIVGGATIEEVLNCTSLSSLEVDFWNSKVFEYYIRSSHWAQLDTFKFTIGQPFVLVSEKRSIAFRGNFCPRGRPILLPPDTSGWYLDDAKDIIALSSVIPNLMDLKYCEVRNTEVHCIVAPGGNKLSVLDKMKLFNLPSLWLISRKSMGGDTLSNLRSIEIVRCCNLRFVFLRCLVGNLQNLEEITVRDCCNMKRMVQEEEEESQLEEEGTFNLSDISFPKLRSLKLYRLPVLKSLYDGYIACDALHSIEISGCDALWRLQLLPSAALKAIIGPRDWWESLEWEFPHDRDFFQPYFREWQSNNLTQNMQDMTLEDRNPKYHSKHGDTSYMEDWKVHDPTMSPATFSSPSASPR
ncbi:hypothetical protein Tsubulata_020417 [Turnera subulata]|uniref:AAA+ ATPase domain-containing protein n=1 Tax=Turnera subulata TaxID=218843 RepID=A0A9Q0FJ79_9ROSI|nr:hypothetical protein Tsubulata_020417 [Turnera subulata]